MNTRAFTLAIIIAAIAAWMAYSYIDGKETLLKQKYGKNVAVVVAKEDIQELELISDNKLTTKDVPQDFVMPGYFKHIKELENTVATVAILSGEQITKPRVTWPDVKTGLSRQVARGKRAISVIVNEQEAVSRLIKPGDRVDIIAGIDYAAGKNDLKKTTTILQDVLVLSTGINISNAIPLVGVRTPTVIKEMNLNTYTAYNTITLELDPYKAQTLLFLVKQMNTTIHFTLRNNSDKKVISKIRSTRLFDILGDDAQEAKMYFKEMNEKLEKGGK